MVHDNIELLIRHLDKIAVPEVRQAYLYLTHHAATLREYECRADEHGDVDDFRYLQGTEWPFAFIVNQRSLLWYFRKAGLRHPAVVVPRLREQFAEVGENSIGEITVRLSSLDDAKRIAAMVFGR